MPIRLRVDALIIEEPILNKLDTGAMTQPLVVDRVVFP